MLKQLPAQGHEGKASPWWAQPLPVPPAYDFIADVRADQKLAAVMVACARVARQRGTTFTEQVRIHSDSGSSRTRCACGLSD